MNEKDVINYLIELPTAEINRILKNLTIKEYTALLGAMINTCIELNRK